MRVKTPICEFAKKFSKRKPTRFHVPGHKGKTLLGFEKTDLTEVDGADQLYTPDGIIKESEQVASQIFGCHTFYSTEGSSLSIRAMVYLACFYAKLQGKNPLIFSTRNAHKSFLTAVGLLQVDVEWLDNVGSGFISCQVTAEHLQKVLESAKQLPVAVYVTSPDYFGQMADVKGLAKVCHEHGVLLLVDCAHGAYLKFLSPSLFPIDLGADMCACSAHKTLPAVTGSGYLHLSNALPDQVIARAKTATSVFGSTSPSYLILQSLDYCNYLIKKEFESKLKSFIPLVDNLKIKLSEKGYTLLGNEGLKITLNPLNLGYTGKEIKQILLEKNVYVEFCDSDNLVLMLSPYNTAKELSKLQKILLDVTPKQPIERNAPKMTAKTKGCSVKEVLSAPTQTVPVKDALGKIYAQIELPCPPAVPIVVWGEVIDQNALDLFDYYGITHCDVLKQKVNISKKSKTKPDWLSQSGFYFVLPISFWDDSERARVCVLYP